MSHMTDEVLPTRERILREAATLFSVNGYHGTSTRDIAGRVGIRQPSLFHHFESKQAIADQLFEIDLNRSVRASTQLARATGPASLRLFRYLRFELTVTVTSPYDLRGLYLTDLLADPAFARWQSAYQESLTALREMVVQGIESGEFLQEDPALFVEVLNSVITHAVITNTAAPPDSPNRLAALLLRTLLQDPKDLEEILQTAPAVETELH